MAHRHRVLARRVAQHVHPVRNLKQFWGRTKARVANVGFTEEEAAEIARRPNAFAAAFFGGGLVVGATFGALLADLFAKPKTKE